MQANPRSIGAICAVLALIIPTGCRNTSPDGQIRVKSDPLAQNGDLEAPPTGLRGLFRSRRISEDSAAQTAELNPRNAMDQQVQRASATSDDGEATSARFSFTDESSLSGLTPEERELLEQAFANSTPAAREEAARRLRAARAAKSESTNAIAQTSEKIPALPTDASTPAEPPAESATASSDPSATKDASPVTDRESFTMPDLKTNASAATDAPQPTSTAQANPPSDTDGPAEISNPSAENTQSAAPQDTAATATAQTSTTDTTSPSDPVETVADRDAPRVDRSALPTTPSVSDSAQDEAGAATATHLANVPQDALLSELIRRYQEAIDGQRKAPTIENVLALRTLTLLDGRPDDAMLPVRNWTTAEQDYLNHQMLTLWQLLDPEGHPVREQRWDMALPHLRDATSHLGAATGSLDVRSLQFCREVNGYGQTVPFDNPGFTAGQQVILYCEVENFDAERLSDGFETHLKGQYYVIDAAGKRVAEQALAEDRQTSANFRRDYFLAYILYLPEQLGPGNYRLELTLEDLKGEKYGQSSIPLEIKTAAE